MKKKIRVLMVGLTLAAMTGTAFAAAPVYGLGRAANGPGFMDPLILTPEQRTKTNELRERYWKDTVSLRNDMETKRMELRTLWRAPHPDQQKILAKQKELNVLRNQLQAKITESRLEVRKILTPEQISQRGVYRGGIDSRGMGRFDMRGSRSHGRFGPGGPWF